MKIGMLSGLWFLASAASIFESLQHVASLGFHYVDLHGVFHAGPAHLTQRERIAVKTELDALGLKPRNYVLHALHNIAYHIGFAKTRLPGLTGMTTPRKWSTGRSYGVLWS